jgi:hypothetical protein
MKTTAKMPTAGVLIERFGKRAPWLDYQWLNWYTHQEHPVLRSLRPNRPDRWKLAIAPSEGLAGAPNLYSTADVVAIIKQENSVRRTLKAWATGPDATEEYKFYVRLRGRPAGVGEESKITVFGGFTIDAKAELVPDAMNRWQLVWLFRRSDLADVRDWVKAGKPPKVHPEGDRVYLPEYEILNRLNKGMRKVKVTHGWVRQAVEDGRIERIPLSKAKHPRNGWSDLYVYDWEQAKAEHALTIAAKGDHPRTDNGTFAAYARPQGPEGISEKLDSIKGDTSKIDKIDVRTRKMHKGDKRRDAVIAAAASVAMRTTGCFSTPSSSKPQSPRQSRQMPIRNRPPSRKR